MTPLQLEEAKTKIEKKKTQMTPPQLPDKPKRLKLNKASNSSEKTKVTKRMPKLDKVTPSQMPMSISMYMSEQLAILMTVFTNGAPCPNSSKTCRLWCQCPKPSTTAEALALPRRGPGSN